MTYILYQGSDSAIYELSASYHDMYWDTIGMFFYYRDFTTAQP